MKIQLVSDAHLLMDHVFNALNPDADLFIIAGDLAASPAIAKKVLTKIRKQTDIPIIYVLGNHEYYTLNLYTAIDVYKKVLARIKNLYILEQEGVELGGVCFWGTTLWSDLSDPMAALTVQRALMDYEMIEKAPGEPIKAIDTQGKYLQSVKWLTEKLEANTSCQNVVITHHAPCWACRDTQFDYDSNNRWVTCGFCNRLDALMHKYSISHWFYGHTHKSFKFRVGETQIVSNQMGLRHEQKHSGFNPRLLIEI